MRKKILLIILGIVLLMGLGYGTYYLISTSNQMKYEGFIIEKGNKGKFEIYDKTLYYEGYEGDYDKAYYITGSIKNSSKSFASLAIITFNLYDKDKNVIGVAKASVTNLGIGVAKKFKAMSLSNTKVASKVVSYDLKSIIKY